MCSSRERTITSDHWKDSHYFFYNVALRFKSLVVTPEPNLSFCFLRGHLSEMLSTAFFLQFVKYVRGNGKISGHLRHETTVADFPTNDFYLKLIG